MTEITKELSKETIHKRFVAIKDCEIVHRNNSSRKSEKQNFIQLNLNSIILLRPEKLPEKAPIKKAKSPTK